MVEVAVGTGSQGGVLVRDTETGETREVFQSRIDAPEDPGRERAARRRNEAERERIREFNRRQSLMEQQERAEIIAEEKASARRELAETEDVTRRQEIVTALQDRVQQVESSRGLQSTASRSDLRQQSLATNREINEAQRNRERTEQLDNLFRPRFGGVPAPDERPQVRPVGVSDIPFAFRKTDEIVSSFTRKTSPLTAFFPDRALSERVDEAAKRQSITPVRQALGSAATTIRAGETIISRPVTTAAIVSSVPLAFAGLSSVATASPVIAGGILQGVSGSALGVYSFNFLGKVQRAARSTINPDIQLAKIGTQTALELAAIGNLARFGSSLTGKRTTKITKKQKQDLLKATQQEGKVTLQLVDPKKGLVEAVSLRKVGTAQVRGVTRFKVVGDNLIRSGKTDISISVAGKVIKSTRVRFDATELNINRIAAVKQLKAKDFISSTSKQIQLPSNIKASVFEAKVFGIDSKISTVTAGAFVKPLKGGRAKFVSFDVAKSGRVKGTGLGLSKQASLQSDLKVLSVRDFGGRPPSVLSKQFKSLDKTIKVQQLQNIQKAAASGTAIGTSITKSALKGISIKPATKTPRIVSPFTLKRTTQKRTQVQNIQRSTKLSTGRRTLNKLLPKLGIGSSLASQTSKGSAAANIVRNIQAPKVGTGQRNLFRTPAIGRQRNLQQLLKLPQINVTPSTPFKTNIPEKPAKLPSIDLESVTVPKRKKLKDKERELEIVLSQDILAKLLKLKPIKIKGGRLDKLPSQSLSIRRGGINV